MYSKTKAFRDYLIDFDYDLDVQNQALSLVSWKAYQDDTARDIPCAVESQFIERELYKWLDAEFSRNGDNYLEDYLAYLGEKSYDNSKG